MSGVVAKLVHHFGQLLDLLFMRAETGILTADLLRYIRADFGHALTHVDALLAPNRCHDQLRKPRILTRSGFLAKLGEDVELLRPASPRRASYASRHEARDSKRREMLSYRVAGNLKPFGK